MNFVKYIFLLVLLLFVLLAIRSGREAGDLPVSEDGFFSMTVSRNIAHGYGITIDKDTPTNGFQPLFTFITVPIFSISNKLLSVRLLLILQIIIFGLTAYILGILVRDFFKEFWPDLDNSFNWLVSLMYISGQMTFLEHLNGLETGFYLFMIVLSIYYYVYYYRDDKKSMLILGLLLGLTTLTRIDFAIFVVIFTAAVFFFDREKNFKQKFTKALIISGTALIVSSPWWIYNYAVFGSLMPTSGQAQQLFKLDAYRIFNAAHSVLADFEIFTTKISSIMAEQMILIMRLIFLAIIFIFILPLLQLIKIQQSNEHTRKFKHIFLLLFVFSFVLVIWYSISNWAVYFYPRYFMPIVPVSVLILSLALMKIIILNKKLKSIFTTLFAVAAISFLLIIQLKIGIHGSGFLNNQLPLIEKHVPKNEKVAAGQTGTIGYFLDNVVNLDGKVNYKALKYRIHMWDYLDKNKIPWFCDWQMGVNNFLGNPPEKRGWIFVEKKGDFLLYHKKYQ